MKKAFTLAEILITLGIIGVVAAITIPTVIKHHQQKVVVTRLQKFYTIINQAIKLSEAENGNCGNWDIPDDSDINGNPYTALEFYNTYLANYIKSNEIELAEVTGVDGIIQVRTVVSFADGSAMTLASNHGIVIHFYPYKSKLNNVTNPAKEQFAFSFNKINSVEQVCSVEPYTYTWNGTRAQLISKARYGCNKTALLKNYCAKLIQYDGWKISKDYPW